jgi:hypothetical protein
MLSRQPSGSTSYTVTLRHWSTGAASATAEIATATADIGIAIGRSDGPWRERARSDTFAHAIS